MKNIIAASILSADFSNLAGAIKECEKAGVDWIHIDVMDGHFVPNLTMGPFIVETCKRITNLPLDCHLMVEKPESLIKSFVDAGADYLTIHPENNPNVLRTLGLIRNYGIKAGVAINPGTSHLVLEPMISFVDMVLVMSVNPGFSGQSFLPEMSKKVVDVACLIHGEEHEIRLEVDGGINAKTILSMQQAGADTFVSASAIFNHPAGIAAGVDALKRKLI
ncbi:MAG TPA: ribulose-phosphate 3-epimerase [Anaerolineaceae bacterium]|nr:ribulose-phosphate 3-epimerase [Anaerolineaceae bacterium]